MKSAITMLLFFLVSLTVYAQSVYPVNEIPSTMKNKANAVIREMETVTDMRAPDQVIKTVKEVITVLNKNGDARADLAIYYNKSIVIKNIKGSLYNADGQLTGKFSQSDFKDESAISDFSLYEDDRVKRYLPAVTSYPYTIVYEYEIRNKQNLILPDWDANPYPDVSIQKNRYTFICKPGDQLRIKEYNYKGKRTEEKTQEKETYNWAVSDLPAFNKEPFSPDPEQYLTTVKIVAQNFVYYNSKGNYKNWEDLGKWIYTDLVQRTQDLTPTMISEVKELVKNVDGQKNKARKIYEYMQQKTRYISVQIGIGGYRPMSAASVDQLGYGDCKALVNYTQSLLKAADIPSYYCIVEAGNLKKSLDPSYASMNQANHIILCLPLENDTTWLECTNQNIPFGFLGDFTDDRLVLACTPEGGKLMKTPALTAQMNLTKRSADLTLDEKGSLSGWMNTTYKGAQYDQCEALIYESGNEQLKMLTKQYDIDNIDFTSVKFTQEKSQQPSTSESLKFTIDRYAPFSDSRIYLVANVFNKLGTVPDLKNRMFPVYINRGYTDEDELVYHIPDGYLVEMRPANQEVKTQFGSYTVNLQIEPKKITYTRKFVLNAGTYPAAQYADLAKFMLQVNMSDQSKVVFKNPNLK